MKKTVQELHKEYNLYDEEIKLYLVHKFDNQLKSWKFNGYRCVHCGSVFKQVHLIDKHKLICKELNKNTRTYGAEDPDIIITTDRTPWDPIYKKYAKNPN